MRRTLREGIGIDTADALRQRFAGEPDGAAYADGLFALGGTDSAAIYIFTAQVLFELMASQSAADWLRTANKYQMTVRPRPDSARAVMICIHVGGSRKVSPCYCRNSLWYFGTESRSGLPAGLGGRAELEVRSFPLDHGKRGRRQSHRRPIQ